MLVKYNSLNRTEAPVFTLCNPGSIYNNGFLTNVIGVLSNHEAEEIVFNFNSLSELSFRIHKVSVDNATAKQYCIDMYNAVKNRRLIFIDGIGYFSITEVNESYQDGLCFKDVKAESVDSEIQQKMIPYIEDNTYRFLSNSSNTGILNKIVEVLPLWSIGDVDSSVAGKFRTFNDVEADKNCLSFLLNDIQDSYECIVLFDNINRTINVYSQSTYIKKTGIYLTSDDVVKSLNIKENSDDLYTAVSVEGDDELNITAINPTGANVIYRFNYYLDWMSTSLKSKVTAWQNAISSAESSYYSNSLNYYNQKSVVYNLQADIDKIDTQKKMYTRCKENIIANADTSLVGDYNTVIVQNGGTAVTVYPEIADTISGINSLIASCSAQRASKTSQWVLATREMNTYLSYIEEVNHTLSIQNYFTQEEYAELSNYIYEGSYRDEYITVTDNMTYSDKFRQMKILYDRAVSQLLKISEPTQEFDVDVESAIFQKGFSHWNDQLETGCLINVEVGHNDIAMLFLSTITINYDDKTLKLTFGNRFNKYDTKSLFDKVLGNISKSANTLNYVKEILTPIKNGTIDTMQIELQSTRDITMEGALSSENEEVLIDKSGYTGRRKDPSTGEFDPQQIKITGKNIVFTSDAWETCRTAVGELNINGTSTYGVNAETIIGDLIIGNSLKIKNSSNSLLFDNSGLCISNSTNSFQVNPSSNNLIVLSRQVNGVTENIFYVDDNGLLHLKGDGADLDLSSNGTIQVAWNNISQYIQLEEVNDKAVLSIYNASADNVLMRLSADGLNTYSNNTDNDLLMRIDSYGSNYYLGTETVSGSSVSRKIGSVGTGTWGDPNMRGIVFRLDYVDDGYDSATDTYNPTEGRYMSWGCQETPGGHYTVRLAYLANTYLNNKKGLHIYDDVMFHRNDLHLSDFVSIRSFVGATQGTYDSGLYSTTNEVFSIGNTARLGSIDSAGQNLYWIRATQSGIDCHGDIDMGNYTIQSNSDIRLKTNIQSTNVNALNLLNRIDLKSFDWIESGKHEEIGVIAQQLKEVIPCLVNENPETTKLSIEFVKFIPYLIKAVQELTKIVDPLGFRNIRNNVMSLLNISDYSIKDKYAFIQSISDSDSESYREAEKEQPIFIRS